jgi:hypothetical protein
MLRVVPLFLAAAAFFGQTPPPTPQNAPPQASQSAPPEVDTALRARITQFYQLQVDSKFMKALQLVAEDTQDKFVELDKPTYRSFQIGSIRYSDDFTKAEALLTVDRVLAIQGFIGHPLPMKLTSRWKLQDGQWFYYVDPEKDRPVSPFSAHVPGIAKPPSTAASAPRPLPPMPKNLPDPRWLNADKTSVQLKSTGPSAEQVTISNPSPWPATLTFSGPTVDGLEVKLDPMTVNARQKAILSIRSSGAPQTPKTPITIMVTVRQTKQTIPIKVTFAN